MFKFVRRLLIGKPISSQHQLHHRLPKFLALPVFSSDAVSSVAYGPAEVLITLAVIGPAVWAYSMPIGIAITILIAIVTMSYRQTIFAYPKGGGSYIVAKENLGTNFGLVAAAAILTDYVLTVAVSIAAGIEALVAIEPALAPQVTHLCVFAVALVGYANMRGLKESGVLFAPPTYGFVGCLLFLVIVGVYKTITGGEIVTIIPPEYNFKAIEAVSLWAILRAFSSGCSALTGIEAIADGVPAFKPPESKNAASTMIIMAAILSVLVLGITYLGHVYHALPGTFLLEHKLTDIPDYERLKNQTMLAQLTYHFFGGGNFYVILNVFTCAILILAANTAFQDFPRLSSILARDRFAPRQLATVGDRLVFSNGIVLLSLLAILLLILFKGKTNALIPLYAVGVFIAFTLSQFGMAARLRKLKPKGWQVQSWISTFGAIITGGVAFIIGITKFFHGAWIAIVLISALVFVFYKINKHYIELGNQLRLTKENYKEPEPIKAIAIVLTSSIHKGVLPALEYAKTLSHDCRALFIEIDPVETQIIRDRWEEFGLGIPLVILESPYRTLIDPVLRYLDEENKDRKNHIITVVVPEFVPAKWWHKLLHNQQAFILKLILMFRRDIVVTYVRYYLEK